MAVSEALSNVVRHAYASQASSGLESLHSAIVDGVLEVVVCDEGVGVPAPEQMPQAGYGLMLMACLADRLELTDAAPGLEVHLSFPLG